MWKVLHDVLTKGEAKGKEYTFKKEGNIIAIYYEESKIGKIGFIDIETGIMVNPPDIVVSAVENALSELPIPLMRNVIEKDGVKLTFHLHSRNRYYITIEGEDDSVIKHKYYKPAGKPFSYYAYVTAKRLYRFKDNPTKLINVKKGVLLGTLPGMYVKGSVIITNSAVIDNKGIYLGTVTIPHGLKDLPSFRRLLKKKIGRVVNAMV